MGATRPNATERRLARVRALKAEFFGEELSVEEQLAAKDIRIAELEREVEVLRLKLERQRPEGHGPRSASTAPTPSSPQTFDFYRD